MNNDDRIMVLRNPQAILEIKKPDEELILTALRMDGLLIRHFKNQTEAMQTTAYFQNKNAIKYINNPSEVICRLILNEKEENKVGGDWGVLRGRFIDI